MRTTLFRYLAFFITIFLLVAGHPLSGRAETFLTMGTLCVDVLVDAERTAPERVLRRVTPQILKRYVPEGRFSLPVNAVLVRTPEQTILIDAGFGNNLPLALAKLNVTTEDVDTILLTHLHADHFEGLLREGAAVFDKARLFVYENARMYWDNETPFEAYPHPTQQQLATVRQKCQQLFAAYKGRITSFVPAGLDEERTDLLPGIDAIAAYGHTPGHTVFRIHAHDKQLLVLGDVVLAGALQFAYPEVTCVFDMNQELAAQTRMRFFAYAAQHKIPVTGMHFTAPQIGILENVSQRGVRYKLQPYQE